MTNVIGMIKRCQKPDRKPVPSMLMMVFGSAAQADRASRPSSSSPARIRTAVVVVSPASSSRAASATDTSPAEIDSAIRTFSSAGSTGGPRHEDQTPRWSNPKGTGHARNLEARPFAGPAPARVCRVGELPRTTARGDDDVDRPVRLRRSPCPAGAVTVRGTTTAMPTRRADTPPPDYPPPSYWAPGRGNRRRSARGARASPRRAGDEEGRLARLREELRRPAPR